MAMCLSKHVYVPFYGSCALTGCELHRTMVGTRMFRMPCAGGLWKGEAQRRAEREVGRHPATLDTIVCIVKFHPAQQTN